MTASLILLREKKMSIDDTCGMRASKTNGWFDTMESWNDFETSVACDTLNALTGQWGKEPYFQLWFYLLLTVLSFALCKAAINGFDVILAKMNFECIKNDLRIYHLIEIYAREKKRKKLTWTLIDIVTHYVYSRMTFTLQRSGQRSGADRENCVHKFQRIDETVLFPKKNWFNAPLRCDTHPKFPETSFISHESEDW